MEQKKEKLTLEDYFLKHENKTYVKSLSGRNEGLHDAKAKFKIVGYFDGKKSNCMLIGKLVGDYGISHHFKNPKRLDVIPNHEQGNNYVYVNLRRIESYPEVKKTINKKERKNETTLNDLIF